MEFPHYKLLSAAILNSFLSTFFVGYQLSIVNVPEELLKNFTRDSYDDQHRNGSHISDKALNALWGFVVSSNSIGAIFGSLLVAVLADRFGRRNSLFLFANVIVITGSILMAIAKVTNNFEVLIIGRIVVGIAGGLSGGLLAMYLMECTPTRFRGAIGTLQNLFITSSTLIGTGVSWGLGSEHYWNWMMGLPAGLALLQMLSTPLYPESPKYLYIHENKGDAARKSLKFYYGPDVEFSEVFRHYDAEHRLTSNVQHVGIIQVLTNRNLRWPLILGICCAAGSISLGILVIFSYSAGLFQDLQLTRTQSNVLTLGLSLSNLAGAIASTPLLGRIGRRPALFFGMIGCTACNVMFLIFRILYNNYKYNWMAYVCIVALYIHVCVFNLGPGPIPWFYSSEVSPQNARSTIAGASVCANWLCGFIMMQIFGTIESSGPYAFLLFIIPSLLFMVFLMKYMPETKDRATEQILNTWWVGEVEGAVVRPEESTPLNRDSSPDYGVGSESYNYDRL